MEERLALLGDEQMKALEKQFLLQMIDMHWREHLMHLDHLRAVIGLRGYGQRDPLNEYKTEAFSLFETLLVNLRHGVTRWLMTMPIQFAPNPQTTPDQPEAAPAMPALPSPTEQRRRSSRKSTSTRRPATTSAHRS